ncbi:hypothetical protein E143388_05521 [Rhodococcus opacus]|nr:hypothetical protein E143388_05521 [Rhodococcus opacus]
MPDVCTTSAPATAAETGPVGRKVVLCRDVPAAGKCHTAIRVTPDDAATNVSFDMRLSRSTAV